MLRGDVKAATMALAIMLCLGLHTQEQQSPTLTGQDIQAASWDFQN
jgi:hypothetical protein